MNCKSIFILFSIFFISCSSHDSFKFKRKNLKVESIERVKEDIFYPIAAPKKNETLLTPFEEQNLSYYKITKEFFKCKGNPLNPARSDISNNDKDITDCEGTSKHGLCIINSKEGVYPILLELLNYIQKKTNKKIVITCGHRCPKHNKYSDLTNEASNSKHMIGAEVDFYVPGYELNPDKIVDLILDFYKLHPRYRGRQEFENFLRFTQSKDVSTQPWYNKEIAIKIFKSNEGRDFDNRHPYPYVSIQVLWDRNLKENVAFSLEKANKGYLHW